MSGRDFNDVACEDGAAAVRSAFENAQPVAKAVSAHSTKDGLAKVELIPANALKPEPVRWLWPGWLARGKFHVLAGAPGTGKTTIAMNMAATVSIGGQFPDSSICKPGRVLIWSGEDDPSDTLVPRLIAGGANLSNVHFVGDYCKGQDRQAFDPSRDVPLLLSAIKGGDVSLIIVDPLVSAVSGDSHKNAEVRRSLGPLADLAVRCDAALLGITHYSKGTQGRDPLDRVSGSLAFGALARVVFGTAKEEGDEGSQPTMKLARMKSNIGRDDGGFAYEFEQVEIKECPGVIASRVVWGEALVGTARELLGGGTVVEDGPQGEATRFLRGLLETGSMMVRAIFKEAEQAGYSRDQMKRAKSKLKAEAIKCGMTGGWLWKLPKTEARNEGREEGAFNRPPPSLSSESKPRSSGLSEPLETADDEGEELL